MTVSGGAPAAHETRRQVLLVRVRAFIEATLPDPGLGPAAIAAYHHISVRLSPGGVQQGSVSDVPPDHV
ncbi:hypothetical protein ABZ615_06705 [Streptomyces sp. NPDC007325]|uniref:hypothetical protein n=1 Tax=Streptomyces sp. NPDC007325 TaxID=3154588 RepID=UPI00340F4304